MRKDVQFGLAIGGSLLSVLVIYLLLFNHTSRKSSDVALAPAPAATTDGKPAPVDLTQTALPAQPLDAHSADITRTDAATQPSGTADTSSTGRDWNALLESGAAATDANLSNATSTSVTSAAIPAVVREAALLSTSGATTRPSSAVAAAQSTHKVASGETFYTIAAAVYGDSKYFSKLEDANPQVKPNRLRIGAVIKVPALNAPSAPFVAVSDTVLAPTTQLDPARSYRVHSSDTLMAIARRLYGNGQAWEKIYDANRDAIGPNPARLKVNMVLRLPDPPTVALAN